MFENGVLPCLADYSVEAESVGSAEYVVLKLVALGILSWPCTVVVLFRWLLPGQPDCKKMGRPAQTAGFACLRNPAAWVARSG